MHQNSITANELLNLVSKIVKFRRLAMVLLGECPRLGEYAARPVKALDRVFANGSGVVCYEIPDEPNSYVVLRPDGTRYTSPEPPDDVEPKNFFVEKPFTYDGSYVWEKLESIATELQTYGADIDKQHGIKATVQFIESLRNHEISGVIKSQQIIADIIYSFPEVTESKQSALKCSNECLNKIFRSCVKIT
jgi:hypothetical protein